MTPSLSRIALALLAAGLVAFVVGFAAAPGTVHARALADDSSSARVSMDHWLTVRRAPPPLRQVDSTRGAGARRAAGAAPAERAQRPSNRSGAGDGGNKPQ